MDAQELATQPVYPQDTIQQHFLDAPGPSLSRQSTSGPRSSVSTARSRVSNSDSHGSGRGSHDSKPRLSKEQHETLERHYQCEPKPSTQTKKEFSTRLGVSVEKVNNWFQNRRAKTKHELKKQREQQNQLHVGAEQFIGNEQFGHPLADNHLIDEAFYQTIGGAPNPNLQQHFARPDQAVGDSSNFSNIPTIPEEPAVIGEDPGFYNFFGLPDGDQQKVDMSTVAEIRKQFNPPSLQDFDPAAMLRQAKEAYYRGDAGETMASPHDVTSGHASIDYSTAGSFPGLHESRRPSSSMVSMTTAPTVESRTSSTSWNQQQQENFYASISGQAFHAFGSSHSGYFPPDGMRQHYSGPSMQAMRQDSMIYSPTDAGDTSMAYAEANIAMPQPVLPSQTIAGQQPSESLQPSSVEAEMFFVDPGQSIPAPMDSQAPSRCDSGTSMLTDPMDHQYDIHNGNSVMPHLKHSHSSATLAARRHRRPAQLGQAAMRSMSYNNGPPSASDATASFSGALEYPLRRIKSSTVIGGRIQKPGSAASQRSPFSVSFSDAAQRSPAPFTPGETNQQFLWPQNAQAAFAMQTPVSLPAHGAPMQPLPQQFHPQQTPLPLEMAQQLHATQLVQLQQPGVLSSQQSSQQAYSTPTGSAYAPTPQESHSSMSSPQQKPTPELQFQAYQPREPVDPASLPPKTMNNPPRSSYQFQNLHQTTFVSPRGSSVKSTDTP